MKISAKKLHYPCYLLLIFDNVEAFTVSLIITSILEVRVFLVCKNNMKQISTCYHWVSANSHHRKKNSILRRKSFWLDVHLHFFKFFLNTINFKTFSRVASYIILKLCFVEYLIKLTRTRTRTFSKSVTRIFRKSGPYTKIHWMD